MLWLYILLGILLAILLILLIPVGVDAKYDEDFFLKIKIGFVGITLFPQKPKKSKKKKKQKQPTEKPKEDKPKEKKPNIIQQKGLSWLVDVIKKVAELAGGALKYFFKHIIIKKLLLSISVAEDNAAETAVKYGKLCAVIYPSIGIITRSAKCKEYGVDITPNFNEKSETKLYFELKARVLILWLLTLVAKYGIKGIKLMLEIKDE